MITSRVSLDREKQWLHELQVVAADLGTPPKQSEVIVQVNVTDMNDHKPRIVEPSEDLLTVREGQPRGTEVTRFVVTDPDNGENATVVFSLVNGESNSTLLGKKSRGNHTCQRFYGSLLFHNV